MIVYTARYKGEGDSAKPRRDMICQDTSSEWYLADRKMRIRNLPTLVNLVNVAFGSYLKTISPPIRPDNLQHNRFDRFSIRGYIMLTLLRLFESPL